MKRSAVAALAVSISLLSGTSSAADEVSERVVRSYVRSMVIIDECRLAVPPTVFQRLLDFGRDLQVRMHVTDEEAESYTTDEAEAFDPAASTCTMDDDRVASVLGFIQEQAVIVGVNSGLGVRDDEAIGILGGLFMTVGVLEYCQIPIDTDVAGLIGQHAERLQERLGMSMEQSEAIYQRTLGSIRADAPSCADGSPALRIPLAMIEDYKAELSIDPAPIQ